VSGIAWFDHQWGDFIAVGAGGWDWFSVQLGDGRDLTLSLVHGPNGEHVLDYGTLVAADGTARHLDAADFTVSVLDRWKSPHSGADYPAEWRIQLPTENVTLHLTPTLADQELDTRASSGNFYWEGEVTIDGTAAGGAPLHGLGYVELTGYAG
jgi:predicted secreted hydrolase